jgi:GAF domain-containing protein
MMYEQAVAGLQDALLSTENVEQFLGELAESSARLVDGMSCGMTLRRGGRPSATAACSDPLASRLDWAQDEAGDGPCLQAARTGEAVRIDDTRRHERWPAFSRHAVPLGVLSVLALPLTADGETAGALNLYAKRPSAFRGEVSREAERFATRASGALTLALRMASCNDLNDQLRSSLESRAVIDQALGVIMANERCPHDRAFAMLRTVSQNTNVKLRDVATAIVTSVSGEPPRPSPVFEAG